MEIQDILNDIMIQKYVNDEMFASFYERINELLDKNNIMDDDAGELIGSITQLLIKSSIDPLKNLTIIPWSFLWDAKDIENIDLTKYGDIKFSEYGWQFAGSGLKKLIIPHSIKYIPEGFCCECLDLEEIILPATITAIQDEAITYCENLEKIIFQGTIYQWENGMYRGGWISKDMHFTIICSDGVIEV